MVWSTSEGLVDAHVSVDQKTEDGCISEILVSQRGEELTVCFGHVWSGVIGVNLGDNKGTALSMLVCEAGHVCVAYPCISKV